MKAKKKEKSLLQRLFEPSLPFISLADLFVLLYRSAKVNEDLRLLRLEIKATDEKVKILEEINECYLVMTKYKGFDKKYKSEMLKINNLLIKLEK